MGGASAAAGWTVEDDVLLKNAVEVIYSALPDPSVTPVRNPRKVKYPGTLRPIERALFPPARAEFRCCSTN
jgi:hypothetical protein